MKNIKRDKHNLIMGAMDENWGACDVVMILHELHKLGYEQLRLHCGMAPNGMAWRWNIYPKCLVKYAEWERYYDCLPFECPHGSAACPKTEVDHQRAAYVLLYSDRELLEQGKRPDKSYVRWFAQLVEHARRGEYPVAFGEYFSCRSWKFSPSDEPLSYPPFRPIKVGALRYNKSYQTLADEFAKSREVGWTGAKYLGHYHEFMCDGEGPAWLAFVPTDDHEGDHVDGLFHYIFINEHELVHYSDLCDIRSKCIIFDRALNLERRKI